jgi:hypothetical protein
VALSTVTEVCGFVTVTLGVFTTFTSCGSGGGLGFGAAQTFAAIPAASIKTIRCLAFMVAPLYILISQLITSNIGMDCDW